MQCLSELKTEVLVNQTYSHSNSSLGNEVNIYMLKE